jgi:hypothetical protein
MFGNQQQLQIIAWHYKGIFQLFFPLLLFFLSSASMRKVSIRFFIFFNFMLPHTIVNSEYLSNCTTSLEASSASSYCTAEKRVWQSQDAAVSCNSLSFLFLLAQAHFELISASLCMHFNLAKSNYQGLMG